MTAPQYPVCLNVEGEACLIVGGGRVAARKVAELLHCGALVRVVSPEICEEIRLHEKGGVTIERRPFVDADVEGALIVVAATDDREVNERVARAARRARALVNVVDVPEHCLFTAPAVVRRGPLMIAISTTGTSPAIAGRLRGELDELIAPEWQPALEEISRFRQDLLEQLCDEPERRGDILKQVSRLDLVSIIRRGGVQALRRQLKELLSCTSSENGVSDG
jgi:precorrin-2 dehydrogenase / sirohydrochlorin ferrochelatase